MERPAVTLHASDLSHEGRCCLAGCAPHAGIVGLVKQGAQHEYRRNESGAAMTTPSTPPATTHKVRPGELGDASEEAVDCRALAHTRQHSEGVARFLTQRRAGAGVPQQ
jgi:hypothetical protein